MFVTGQRLIDQFDPAIKPKILHDHDGAFIASLPAGGWATDAERLRHIRSIDAENGRWYIHAVFDANRGRSFCATGRDAPNDDTFYDDTLRGLQKLPREQLQRRSAADLLAELWSRRWPCPRPAGSQR